MTSLCVIVPIYNVEPYLEECLDSLLHQEIDDYEVILVNDGSTDGSQRSIDRYVAAYPRIFRAVWQENQGLSAARNTGLTYCTKEFVAFLDSDDFISENGYSAVLSAMQKDNADIGVFECVWRYPDGRQEHRPTLPPFLGEFNVRTSILSHCSANNRIFPHLAVARIGVAIPHRTVVRGSRDHPGVFHADRPHLPLSLSHPPIPAARGLHHVAQQVFPAVHGDHPGLPKCILPAARQGL